MGNLSTNMSTAPMPKMLNVGTPAVVKKCSAVLNVLLL